MATYTELAGIQDGTEWEVFLNKVRVACLIKATAVIDSTTPGADVLAWAKSCIAEPVSSAQSVVYYVVGSNATAALSAIYSATDNAVYSNVSDAIDAIYGV